MNRTTSINQQFQSAPSRSYPTDFFNPIMLIPGLLKTQFNVSIKPGRMVRERDTYIDGILPSGPYSLLMIVGFCIIASHYPILSEPAATTSLSQAVSRMPALLDMGWTDVLKMYAMNLGLLTISVTAVLGLCSGGQLKEFRNNAGLAAYFISNILFLVVLKYFIVSMIISILPDKKWALSLVNTRFMGVRYIDWYISILLSVSVLGYAYHLFRDREENDKDNPGLVLIIFLLMIGVIALNGYYFKQKLERRQQKETTKRIPPPVGGDSTAVNENGAQGGKPDSSNIPYNQTLIISSGQINPAIQFVGHRFRGKYWIDAKFQVKNKTNVPVYLPFNNLVRVNFNLGTLMLMKDKRLNDRHFPFSIIPAQKEPLILAGNDSIQVKIRYDVSAKVYDDLKSEHKKGLLKDHICFLEMKMFCNERTFAVNKYGTWDVHFH